MYSETAGGSTAIGYFDGDVELIANFGDANGLGTISGSITNFVVDGNRENGMLNLGTASIGSQGSGFFRGAVTGSDDERSYTGHWGGQFYGNGETDGRPGSVAGTFGGHSTDDAVNFVGAFGAHKQLLNDLRIAHGEGTIAKLYRDLGRIDLLVLDDWGLAPIDAARARDLLEFLDDHFGRRPVIVTSQLPVADWHRQLKGPSLADAILDRLVHGATRFELHGASMRIDDASAGTKP